MQYYLFEVDCMIPTLLDKLIYVFLSTFCLFALAHPEIICSVYVQWNTTYQDLCTEFKNYTIKKF